MGKDKELIRKGGYDVVDAAGGRGGGEGRYEGADKAPAEDRGGTPEGRREVQSLWAVGSRASPSVLFDSAMYTKRGGGGETGADPQAESRRTTSKPVERPPRRPLPHPLLISH